MMASSWLRKMDDLSFKLWIHLYQWRKGIAAVLMSSLVIVGFFFMVHIAQFQDFPTTKRDIYEINVEGNKLHSLTIKNTSPTLPPASPTQSFVFKFLINEPHFCIEKKHLFIIAVTSSPENFEKRIAIRNSWGNPDILSETRGDILFLVGKVKNLRLQKQLYEESMNNRDIIQGDFADSYKNLTLKSMMALKWFSSYCPQVKFLMKTDDDMFVNTKQLADYLSQKQTRRNWIVGCVKTHEGYAMKIRRNKAIPVLSLPYSHPAFLAGAGYVMTGDIVEPLYKKAQTMKIYPVEDVFITGKCSKAIGIIPEHNPRFSCGEAVKDYCILSRRMITGHKIPAEKQEKIWNIVNNPRTCQLVSVDV